MEPSSERNWKEKLFKKISLSFPLKNGGIWEEKENLNQTLKVRVFFFLSFALFSLVFLSFTKKMNQTGCKPTTNEKNILWSPKNTEKHKTYFFRLFTFNFRHKYLKTFFPFFQNPPTFLFLFFSLSHQTLQILHFLTQFSYMKMKITSCKAKSTT